MASSVFWVEPSTMIPTLPAGHGVGADGADRLRISGVLLGDLCCGVGRRGGTLPGRSSLRPGSSPGCWRCSRG